MSKVTAKVTIESNVAEVLAASEEAVNRGLMAIGMEAVTLTHRDKDSGGTPVDTGRLRNSISWAVAGESGGGGDGEGGDDAGAAGTPPKNTVCIGTNVEYAKWVEEGGYNRHAYHMLRNALVDGSDRFEAIMKANLEAENA